VNQFVSKLDSLKAGNFIPDLTFFSVLSNNCVKCLVTLGIITDERKYFKIPLEHIKQDVTIKDSIPKSLD